MRRTEPSRLTLKERQCDHPYPLMPSQFSTRQVPDAGERGLLLAVIETAVADVRNTARVTTLYGRATMADAVAYLREPASDWPYGFERACEHLALSPQRIRAMLYKELVAISPEYAAWLIEGVPETERHHIGLYRRRKAKHGQGRGSRRSGWPSGQDWRAVITRVQARHRIPLVVLGRVLGLGERGLKNVKYGYTEPLAHVADQLRTLDTPGSRLMVGTC